MRFVADGDPTNEQTKAIEEVTESLYAKILPELMDGRLDCFRALMVTLTLITARLLAIITVACGVDPKETFEKFAQQVMEEYQSQLTGMMRAFAEKAKGPNSKNGD